MGIRGTLLVATLGALAAAAIACVGDSPASTPAATGAEGGPCFPNASCSAGLACLSNTCVRLDGGAPGDSGPGPDAGGCTAPKISCGGACVDPTADAKNCGACGTVCPIGTCAPINGVGKCAKRVFVTSTAMAGDLGGDTAKNWCAKASKNLPNTGTFLPWISDSQSSSPSTTFASGTQPIVLAKSPATQISASMDDLRNTGILLHAIDLDENGVAQSGENVWTNTEPKGGPIGSETCANWTNGTHTMIGWVGNTKSNNGVEWSHTPNASYCDTPAAHLYCFEQ